MSEIFAAIDCGSNSTRALLVDESGRALVREMRITRLSEGVEASRALSPEAVDRTLGVLREYRHACDAWGVRRGLLVATSAVRDATNGDEFLELARWVSGFEARVLRGEQEAAYSYAGALTDLDEVELPTMIVDVGGGSTELALGAAQGLTCFSMQLGCVRVSERAFNRGVVTPEGDALARAMIESELERAFSCEPAFADAVGRLRLVGLAGTVATLAQLDTGLVRYERDQVHHRVLTREVVQFWRDRLAPETPLRRLTHAGMVRGREDVIVAGLYILDAVMARFQVDELLSSENDILDALADSLRGA